MKLLPDREDGFALIWYFVSVYLLCLALMEFLGFEFALIAAAWVYAGSLLLAAWNILPELPRTLPGHLIRLLWACIWPYYVAKRWSRKEGEKNNPASLFDSETDKDG